MAEERVRIGRWVLALDRAATRQAYAERVAAGLPVGLCTCDYCRNFALARPTLFPPEARALFDRLGIDARYPSEVVHYHRVRPGEHTYGGWFHMIGRLLEGESPTDAHGNPIDGEGRPVRDFVAWGENCAIRFSAGYLPRPAVFDDSPLVALEFESVVPWVLDVPEPA